MKRKLMLGAAFAAIVPLVLTGCSGTGQSTAGASNDTSGVGGLNIAVVTHATAGDPFFDLIKSGAEKAGKDFGEKITYQGDADPVKQSQLIDSAVASKVDGLVVSMANPDGVKDSLLKAKAAGIPVVTINAGEDASVAVGAITHVGLNPVTAAQATAKGLVDAGKKKILCIIQDAGNIFLETTCKTIAQTSGLSVQALQVDGTNIADVGTTVKSKLLADKSIDGIVTLGSAIADATVQAVSESGSSAAVTGYNLSGDTLDLISSGKMLFTIDQQGFLQGYLPVEFIAIAKKYGNFVGGGKAVNTGPQIVDKTNVDQVRSFSKAGTR